MAGITQDQKNEIRKLTRRANRRIERATGGQKSYLTGQVRRATGAEKFSASYKGMTERQAAAQIAKLKKFLGTKTSTIGGWKETKSKSVSRANKTLTGQGYNLTDEELADILEQLESESRSEFYRAVNLVQAAKEADEEGAYLSSEDIANIIKERASAQEALERALKAREEKQKKAQDYRQKKQFLREQGKKRAKAKVSGKGNSSK